MIWRWRTSVVGGHGAVFGPFDADAGSAGGANAGRYLHHEASRAGAVTRWQVTVARAVVISGCQKDESFVTCQLGAAIKLSQTARIT